MTASPLPDLAIAQARLQAIWGYSAFRPPQDTVIQALLQHQDALIILPTGGRQVSLLSTPGFAPNGADAGHLSSGGVDGKSSGGVARSPTACRHLAQRIAQAREKSRPPSDRAAAPPAPLPLARNPLESAHLGQAEPTRPQD